jgi:hypothetical protein
MRIALTQTLLCLLAGCTPLAAATLPDPLPSAIPSLPPQPTGTANPAPVLPTATPASSATPRSADGWKSWPQVPDVPGSVRAIYDRGQQLGNAPRAFSVLGDCQSEPDVFLGVYDRDPQTVAALPADLQETVAYFAGSFDRPSPTVRGGTTAAALLWTDWTQGRYGCQPNETPLTCELRIHRPSFALVHVGTHYEVRNMSYLQRVVAQLIDNGVVPILVTKADDREGDDRINHDYALLAVQYDLPLWNFWAATAGLPGRGLYTRTDALSFEGDIYLTGPALQIQRLSALQALDAVRRALRTVP